MPAKKSINIKLFISNLKFFLNKIINNSNKIIKAKIFFLSIAIPLNKIKNHKLILSQLIIHTFYQIIKSIINTKIISNLIINKAIIIKYLFKEIIFSLQICKLLCLDNQLKANLVISLKLWILIKNLIIHWMQNKETFYKEQLIRDLNNFIDN